MNYRKIESFDINAIEKEIQEFWDDKNIFQESLDTRADRPNFVFYEGPPSANGKPGIHHMMGRTIKDIFCRYKTLKGFLVNRKGGWDTHGLPIELSVEKKLDITKKDIGTKITVEEYNIACREQVMTFKDMWDDLTVKMGYWLDLENPYVTFENDYMETLWHLIKQLYDKGFIYKGLSIQPYSPAAGTGLSTHELNMPGCYKDVKDTSATAMFKLQDKDEFFLAWTTTPWTLPSNTALAVGKKIVYNKVKTFNSYTHLPITVIIAKELMGKYFIAENAELELDSYEAGAKQIPYKVISEHLGAEFEGTRYEQLLPYAQPEEGDAFKVIIGDFVTTEDGTGIVHLAPSFGADDRLVAEQNGIGELTLVDKEGKFVDEVTDFAGRYVKDYQDDPNYVSVDIDISVKLKKENRAFKVEKYQHNYPHCWRTDKPILYYPLDSWFIKVTDAKERMAELNKTINWKPESTGTGRFGNWLENLNDWNISRSRFWGTPLPIWRTEEDENGDAEEICIGSVAELRAEVEKSVAAGFMEAQLAEDFDLHKPFIDRVFLVAPSGKKMTRQADLIDVWFDSGAMPYAQWHFPFENKEVFEKNFPADFIAEGVDQTRGWFYTLHAIAVMLYDSVAYKNVISNGLLQDKNGLKMSKSKGNTVDPFETIEKHGADITRWYMISNSAPWDNLKFDISGVGEVRRKFFGTLFNTYSFFSLYANIDEFDHSKADLIPVSERPEIDRWIISQMNSLVKFVETSFEDYDSTPAARAIQDFVTEQLSNWYVRLCRKRFWKKGEITDKTAAYQTLHECLLTVSKLMSPISPFYADQLYRSLIQADANNASSVHLSDFPTCQENLIDKDLEERMGLSQRISSMVLALRKKVNIKVRQPLQRIMIPVLNDQLKAQIQQVEPLILSEVNVKEIEYVNKDSDLFTKQIKPNFKVLGKKAGPLMKEIQKVVQTFSQKQIQELEQKGTFALELKESKFELMLEDVTVGTQDIPGWQVNTAGGITVALDERLTDSLKAEGIAREIVNKLQRLRKERDYLVTDRIKVQMGNNEILHTAIAEYKDYICSEILAEEFLLTDGLNSEVELDINGELVEVQVSVLN